MGALADRLKNRDEPLKMNVKPKVKRHELESEFDPVEALDIDEDDLDTENRRQPKLMGVFSKIFGKKYETYKLLEMEMNIIKFEIGEKIAADPETYGLKKGNVITDTLVNRICFGDEEYIALNRKFIIAKAQRKEWEGLLEACKQRSTSIGRAIKEQELEYNE